ncbi:UvrD-helicase domain-containing protein [Cyanobium sp. FGCU-52]|nr:UvrD-helicase domain-containing protein [Cyanobium sp. FGCU52]
MSLPCFDANAFPLDPGQRLLEASAGTGKTFALAHLMLRLVAEESVGLRQLLVVTFTDAAASELRDRIGRRLQQGLLALEDPAGPAPDGVLEQWSAQVLGRKDLTTDQLRGRLLLALEDLDGADITTIHGFCQRTLRRQALEAARAPELAIDTDARALIDQVVHDYWQQQVLALPLPWLTGLKQAKVTSDLLTSLLLDLDSDPALGLDPLPPGLSVDEPLREGLPLLWQRLWQDFRVLWQRDGQALQDDLCLQVKDWRAQGDQKTTPYGIRVSRNRVGEVDRLLAATADAVPDYDAVTEVEPLRDYFHPGIYCTRARKIEGEDRPIRPPRPELMAAVGDLVDGPAEAVLAHACAWGRAELRRRRERAGSLSYADLLASLDPGPQATGPTPLLQAVGERYRVALIDEFQDTDPVQWRLLRCAFGGGEHLLVMVGDPKQAIYRFRGGDIATYRQARATTAEQYGLMENRRSTPELIQALNGFMGPPGLRRSELAVPPVEPKARRHGPPGPALELLWLGGERPAGASPPSKTALAQQVPERTAAHVLSLLRRGAELEEDGQRRPLQPDDLCLLVNRHRQAERLRQALERVGLPSRLVSQADVFATPAATALQRFLDALADPAHGGRLRLLAASPLMGWSAADLASCPPERWSELAGRLDQLARALPRQGLLGVLSELLGSRTLARLARSGRLRADLQQVAELVQRRMHGDQLGVEGAADWLRRLRLDERRRDRLVPDDQQRHSDREDGCVAVVTVHASKGLEYPVVICPYLWQAPGGGGARPGVRWHPHGASGPVLDLHVSPAWGTGWEARRQQQAEEQAEAERLAYVAATRARHLLVLAWGPAAGQQASPLLPWLFPHLQFPDHGEPLGERSDAEWLAELESAAAERGLGLRVVSGADARPEPWVAPAPALELELGPVPDRRFDRSWGRSSYTGWTQASHGAAAPAALDEGRDTSDPSPGDLVPAVEDGAAWPEQGPLAEVPRGAEAGDALHRILEAIDYGDDLADPASRSLTDQVLRGSGIDESFSEPVRQGLARMLATPCGGELGAFRFADLPRERRLNEMNFDLSLERARSAALAAAFRRHPGGLFDAAYAERLEALAIDSRGFLTGSIDLVFTAPDGAGRERWWVADWKSNWLGRRDADGRPVACGPRHYGTAAMAALMVESHYPLQAHLYLVALHRYLGWRLSDYRPERDLGGYVYVFLRGTPGPEGERALPGAVPGMVVERPPLERVLALDAALGLGRPEEEGGGDG